MDEFLEYESSTHHIDEEFDDNHRWAMEHYDLKNYLAHDEDGNWEKLSDDEKLDYCYSLFYAVSKSDFPVLRQTEIFQRLINIDFNHFFYCNVIECIFIGYSRTGIVHTTQIYYNPLIPQKFYNEYMKQLREKSGVKHLKIPSEGTEEYFKKLLHLWYLHKHKKLTAYAIAKEYYDLDKQKEIARSLKAIKKLYESTN